MSGGELPYFPHFSFPPSHPNFPSLLLFPLPLFLPSPCYIPSSPSSSFPLLSSSHFSTCSLLIFFPFLHFPINPADGLRECCKRSLAAKRFWCIVALKLSSSPLAYWSVFRSVVANIICPSNVCGDKNNGVAPTGFWLCGDCPYRAHGVGADELDYRPAMFVRLCRLKPRSQHINSAELARLC